MIIGSQLSRAIPATTNRDRAGFLASFGHPKHLNEHEGILLAEAVLWRNGK